MKNKFSAKEILVPSVSLFIIALVATLFLALVNNATAQRIETLAAAAEAEARETVFPDADNFVQRDNYFEATDKDGNIIGYVFNTSYKGYGGAVSATVGIDAAGTVTGVVPGDLSNETPGLGQNASNASFLNQYVGKSGLLTVVKQDPGESEIQAITSSTITSTAITEDVNQAVEQFNEITGGGK